MHECKHPPEVAKLVRLAACCGGLRCAPCWHVSRYDKMHVLLHANDRQQWMQCLTNHMSPSLGSFHTHMKHTRTLIVSCATTQQAGDTRAFEQGRHSNERYGSFLVLASKQRRVCLILTEHEFPGKHQYIFAGMCTTMRGCTCDATSLHHLSISDMSPTQSCLSSEVMHTCM